MYHRLTKKKGYRIVRIRVAYKDSWSAVFELSVKTSMELGSGSISL